MVKPGRASVDSSSSSSNNDAFSSNNNIGSCKMFKGVRLRKWGKWVSEIRLPNSRERIWLGSYDTQVKAARAFDAALYCLRGKSASFNFPDTPRHLEINNVEPLTHSEIQEVAAKFANKDYHHSHHSLEVEVEEEECAFQQEQEQEEPSLESDKSNNTMREMTNFTDIYDIGDTHNVQVDQQGDWDTMDWTFLNMLDDINASDFGPDKLHLGEFLYPITQVPLFFHGGDEIQAHEDHDALSNHSFLWNWNF